MSELTGYVGGWTVAAVGSGDTWNDVADVGLEPDGNFATTGSSQTKWLAGISGAPDLSSIPEGSTIDAIELSVYAGSPGFVTLPYRPIQVSLSDTVNNLIGDKYEFGINALSGGGWKSWSRTPDEWGIDESELVDWLANPSMAIRASGSGTGTLKIDAMRLQVAFTPPSSIDPRLARIRGGERYR